MRRVAIEEGKYFHIYNRGYGKQKIFLNAGDEARFLFSLLCFQAPLTFSHLNRRLSSGQLPVLTTKGLNLEKEYVDEIVQHRYVELVTFAMMPNHFHGIVQQTKKDGISQYMQRTLNSYTKFFNIKYGRSGHLFQGPYQIVPIESNEQLLYLSAYIHRNSRELTGWTDREREYPWSSYQDYVGKNRWGELLKRNIILDQFETTKEYRDLVEKSGAKEFLNLATEFPFEKASFP